MLKKLMIGTALSALALSGAFAQSNPSTDPPANSQQIAEHQFGRLVDEQQLVDG